MRHRGLRSPNCRITNYKSQIRQRGYMMITLMLAVALITIGLLAVLPDLKQQVQRDREEELRHRGTAYMRAIQHYFKKLGRYPNRIEDLENTNNFRFLRKRYKDPMSRDPVTGKEKDFKFLHQTDINLNGGPVLGQVPGGAQPGGLQPANSAVAPTQASGDSGDSSTGNPSNAGGNPNSPGSPSPSNPSSGSSFASNAPTLGGLPIIGVASTSKAKTIRVFYDKTHYNDWLFIYLAQLDRGGLLVGPVNPGMPPTPNLNGLTPGPGQLPAGMGPGLSPGGQTPVAPQPQQNFGQPPSQQ